jgi:hypothetical protein
MASREASPRNAVNGDAFVFLEGREDDTRILIDSAAGNDPNLSTLLRQVQSEIGQDLTRRRMIGIEEAVNEPDARFPHQLRPSEFARLRRRIGSEKDVGKCAPPRIMQVGRIALELAIQTDEPPSLVGTRSQDISTL